MKKDEVPQENNPLLGGGRKAVYALDEKGRYVVVPSSGWKVEETVTAMAVAEYAEEAEKARALVQAGEASPLLVHMYLHRLDPPTLAQEVGLMHWRVKRHLKPKPFAKLPLRLLQRYAEVLGITVDALRRLPDE